MSGQFQPRLVTELMREKPEPLTWVWEPFIPTGSLTVLSAYMKVGKSTLAYALAIAVAQGRQFLGHPTIGGPVLILGVEEHLRDVLLRLEHFGHRENDPIHLHTGALEPSELPSVRAFVESQGVRLVILDTLANYWDIENENDNAAVTKAVRPFLDLAHQEGTAVLLLHHDRKTGGEGGRGIRGGSALLGLVDQALLLDKRQGGKKTDRTLRTLGRYAESPSEFHLRLEEDKYIPLGTSEELTRAGRMERVEAVLNETPQTVERLSERTGLSMGQIRAALKSLDGSRRVAWQGGVRGNPRVYCRPDPNSVHSDAAPLGSDTQQVSSDPAAQLIEAEAA